MSLLDEIKSPESIKNLTLPELDKLSEEIRRFLTDSISNTGGHLASNLGVVELTIALHKAFDFPWDKIVFDVGHQCYVHKLLTERKDQFHTLRTFKGLSGFPKVAESEYDVFDTGHSSNSLSIALGLKRAYRLKGEDRQVIALLGDGSLTGGMVFEAINDAGNKKDNIIVVLNDNQMSISKNKSSISRYLNKVRMTNSYIDVKKRAATMFSRFPKMEKRIRRMKSALKRILISGRLFEDLGFAYYGPYDGHDISELLSIFSNVKKINKPVLIHVVTKKGKGYPFAENNPESYHGVSKFDIATGKGFSSSLDYSKVFGEELLKLAAKNEKIVAITAAMPTGTGLSEFSKQFKDRFFDVGICEEHAVSLCGGLAAGGMIPVFPVYSSFLQRGFDQLITDAALMNLHILFCVDRGGLVGEDGETHQGVFDIAYLSLIPNMTILAPASFEELRLMLRYGIEEIKGPVALRYPRGGEGALLPTTPPMELGKGVLLHKGEDVTIVAAGRMVTVGLELCSLLSQQGRYADLINLRFIKPYDHELIASSLKKTGRLVILEEGVKSGGYGETILADCKEFHGKSLHIHVPDSFVEHGSVSQLFSLWGMDSASVLEKMKEVFGF